MPPMDLAYRARERLYSAYNKTRTRNLAIPKFYRVRKVQNKTSKQECQETTNRLEADLFLSMEQYPKISQECYVSSLMTLPHQWTELRRLLREAAMRNDQGENDVTDQ